MDLLGQHTGTLPFQISMPKTPRALIPGSREIWNTSQFMQGLREGKRTLCFSFSTFKSEKKKKKLFKTTQSNNTQLL